MLLLADEVIKSRLPMSLNGPSRHFAAMQHFGRFRSEADMDRQAKRVGSVENGPIASLRHCQLTDCESFI
jgi:hypothetical protein